MTLQDFFVGGVAIGLGLLGVAAAISNWEPCYELRKARWFESIAGRSSVRLAYCVVGLGLIVLGISIACGFAPNKSEARRFRTSIATDSP